MAEAAEQLDEQSADVENLENDPGQEQAQTETEGEEQEYEIVLASDEDAESKPETKSTQDYILNRVLRTKDKLQDNLVQERARSTDLQRQLDQLANTQQSNAVATPPNELDFDSTEEYLAAKAGYDRQMLTSVVSEQLNQQQNGHLIAAQEQEKVAALSTYAKNAANLKIKNFNELQDKAFDILGEEFAQMIAQHLPEDAPKLMVHFAVNPMVGAQVRDDYMSNSGGTLFKLGKLAGNLTLKPRQATAAQPEGKIENGAVGGVNEDWQASYDKIMDTVDDSNVSKSLNQIRELKKQAKAAGFDVSTLK